MTYDYVLSVDPGKITGVATWDRWPGRGMPEMQGAELPFLDALNACSAMLQARAGQPVLVVAERFDIDAGTAKKTRGDVHWSLESIGVLRWLCAGREGHDFELRSRSDRKKVPDQALRDLGLWWPGAGHARDAQRQLLRAMASRLPADFERYSWV